MAKWGELMEDVPWPLVVGVAAVAVIGGPRLVAAGRPLLKGAMREFLALRERMHETLAETTERLQDIYAEAQYEYDASSHAAAPAPADEPLTGTQGA
jgi:hypothetical protein